MLTTSHVHRAAEHSHTRLHSARCSETCLSRAQLRRNIIDRACAKLEHLCMWHYLVASSPSQFQSPAGLYWLLMGRGQRRPTVLLYGPMGTGCTTLFHALQQCKLPNGSVTSMQPSEAACTPLQVCAPCGKHAVVMWRMPLHCVCSTVAAQTFLVLLVQARQVTPNGE